MIISDDSVFFDSSCSLSTLFTSSHVGLAEEVSGKVWLELGSGIACVLARNTRCSPDGAAAQHRGRDVAAHAPHVVAVARLGQLEAARGRGGRRGGGVGGTLLAST